jgi:acetyl-CoA carboxylase carboxyl transferase subunit beta
MPIKLPFRPRRESYPPDLWTQCPTCEEMLFNKQLDKLDRVCPKCGHHFRLSASARLELLLDPGSFGERDAGLQSVDPLGFVDSKAYPDRIAAAQLATGMRDAAVWGEGRIGGRRVAIAVMDFGFMGGSMGAVVGEKVTRAAEFALQERIPLIAVSASGGARMQEGTLALMQLAKTVAAVERLRAARVPFVSVLTDPTTGGVFASFSALGDLNLAEPDALIGFAGARVSAGTVGQELPPGFQRAEFLYEHGFVDRVVTRGALRDELIALLAYLRAPDVAMPEASAGGALRSFLAPLVDRGSSNGPDPASDGNGTGRTNGRPAEAGVTPPSAKSGKAAASGNRGGNGKAAAASGATASSAPVAASSATSSLSPEASAPTPQPAGSKGSSRG